MTDRVTLITGAAAGIGAELARVFAARGHRLALVDRNGRGLAALAREIAAAGGRAPIVMVCDLEHPEACGRIAATVARAGVEVEYVVNNADSACSATPSSSIRPSSSASSRSTSAP